MKKQYLQPEVLVQAFSATHVLLTSLTLGNADHTGGTQSNDGDDEYDPIGGSDEWEPINTGGS